MLALEKSLEGYDSGKFPLGIIYHSEGGQSFEENLSVVLDDAVRSSRPVITVRPYGLENVPPELEDRSDEIVGWNPYCIADAIEDSIDQKRTS
ncbi:Protein MTH_538 [Methanothermobacter wolfeii]|nr:Protein MTH_538 [Methanothermobacter wolfeii]